MAAMLQMNKQRKLMDGKFNGDLAKSGSSADKRHIIFNRQPCFVP